MNAAGVRGAAPVERRHRLTAEELYRDYVGVKPVVIEGVASRWPALSQWTCDRFRALAGDRWMRVKAGYVADGRVISVRLRDYLTAIEDHERGAAGPGPPYLHDVPLLASEPALVDEVSPFPSHYLPRWYRPQWWAFSQFFLGPSGTLTPLHFDTLETHNLFFQVVGRKRFTLVAAADRPSCYLSGWRWSPVDAEQPDYERYPRFRAVRRLACVVGPGDILYLPPGTLHQVRSLDFAISFNIDWQTAGSALCSLTSPDRRMPWKNRYYNAVLAVGLGLGVPARLIYPLYRSYLGYLS